MYLPRGNIIARKRKTDFAPSPRAPKLNDTLATVKKQTVFKSYFAPWNKHKYILQSKKQFSVTIFH